MEDSLMSVDKMHQPLVQILRNLLFVLLFSGQLSIYAQQPETGTIIDIDGNVYNTVKIGNQWWMAENLKVTRYRNGDNIPNAISSSEWSGLSNGAYCYYDNNSSNADTYGYLYNWAAVNDNRNIAPEGWHVPTDEEWKELEIFLGMSESQANGTGKRGTDEGGKLKEVGTVHWLSPNTGATNETGFTALAGGNRSDQGVFGNIGYAANFWPFTEYNNNLAWGRGLNYNRADIGRNASPKGYGFSVRCVKDNTELTNLILNNLHFNPDPPIAQESTTISFDVTNNGDLLWQARDVVVEILAIDVRD
jgi:uncharacterized protein (TIGR02145 family)